MKKASCNDDAQATGQQDPLRSVSPLFEDRLPATLRLRRLVYSDVCIDAESAVTQTSKALFLSHGGGPMPLLGDAGHQEMVSCLVGIAANIAKPDAVVVVSAHWEEKLPTVTSGKNPPLIYDYYGFPEESYHVQYPCVGDPPLANEAKL